MAGPSHVNCHRPRPLATLHEKSPRSGQLLTCIVAPNPNPFPVLPKGSATLRDIAKRHPIVAAKSTRAPLRESMAFLYE